MDNTTTKNTSAITNSDLLSLVNVLVKEVHPNFPSSHIVTLDSTFDKELGLDSLSRVQLIARVESKYNLALPEKTFAEADTPRDLLRAILSIEAPAALKNVSQTRPLKQSEIQGIPTEAQTLVEVLDWHAKHHPGRTHIQFYQDDNQGAQINYQQLQSKARQVAAGLQASGLQNSEAVAIMLPTSQEYFFSYFGILLAGGVPVPIYPPARPSQLEDHMLRHSKILQNCGAKLLITVPEARRVAMLLRSQVPELEKIITADALLLPEKSFTAPVIKSSDTAFIQYTSGSTGQPKGVVLSHANLIANIRAMGKVVHAGPKDVFVSWLPLYHDMGLIGAWLGSLYFAALYVVMPPLSFLSRPERWLKAIHQYQGTLSASPNFGYEYCTQRIEEDALAGLDLSSWRAAFNGAETVSAETIKQFIQRFSNYGLKASAMMPVYGLAESSVGLAFPPINRGPIIDYIDRNIFSETGKAKLVSENNKNALKFPSSGSPLPGHQIRIVDQANHELPERTEGRIQFSGPSSTSGYFRNAEKSQALFIGKWLDTGDLGYMAQGELYVTGRVKDIIIRAGRNIYPHELEEAVSSINGIRAGRVAVFASEDNKSKTERLIVLAETRTQDQADLESLHMEINALSSELTGSPPDEIVLAPPNTVLKTSSGKIRRAACRELYETGRIGKSSGSVPWQLLRLSIKSVIPQIKRSYRYIKDWLFASYAWCCYAVLAPIVWLTATFSTNFNRRWSVMSRCARTLAKLTRTPVSVNGLENLPENKKAFILVSNHSSYLDTYALVAYLPRSFRFIAKKELSEKYITRKPLENIHTEFIDRFDVEKSVTETKHLTDLLKAGESLMFFAEGTFTRVPGLMPFRLGAFTLAAETNVPIVPITIRGTRSILRSDSWFPHHGSIHMEIGSTIYPAHIVEEKTEDTWHKAITLQNESREFILRHCGEPDLSHDET